MVLLKSQNCLNKSKISIDGKIGNRVLIVGGGPNGVFAALMLLQTNPSAQIHVVDCRSSPRPQVLLVPFSTVNIMPEEIKRRLWPDKRVRDSIFQPRSRSDEGFWPRTDYKYQPFIEIGEFTNVIKNYLQEFFPSSFNYEIFKSFDVETFYEILPNHDLAIITAGNGAFTKTLRKHMKIDKMTTDACHGDHIDRHGIYLLYRTPDTELYERDGRQMSRTTFAQRGVTYSHSNDSQNHVQIYTFPLGELREIYAEMPESFKTTAAFCSSKQQLSLAGSEILSEKERVWLASYRTAIKHELDTLKVPHPRDDEIRVCYAGRSEYFYDVAAAEMGGTPVLFVGDSCGGTEYRLGLSLGRGLITSMNLAREMQQQGKFVFEGIIDYANLYWKKIIASEFEKNNSNLSRTPEMVFKYAMDGRMVDGELVDREAFISEVKKIEAQSKKTRSKSWKRIVRRVLWKKIRRV